MLVAGRRLFLALRQLTGRVRAPWFWRAVYWLFERRLFVSGLATAFELTARRRGTTGRRIADRMHELLYGWPHHPGTRWVNLDVDRLHWRVLRRLEDARPCATGLRRPPAPTPTRVGVVARFERTHFFTPAFFRAAPPGTALFVFDRESTDTRPRRAFAGVVERYERYDMDDPQRLAEAIEEARLDLLLVDARRRPWIDDVFDRLATTPCVAAISGEVFVRHHPRVDFHLYPLQQADYLIRDNHMFCCASRARFSQQLVFSSTYPYEDHDLSGAPRPPWREREPLVVLHGRLYKASQAYLDTIFAIVAEDKALTFAAYGEDTDGTAVERIRATARRFGVESQFAYGGPFTPTRDESGKLEQHGWPTLFDALRRARLAPDPWPLAGGITRLEAFLCGAPVAHMGIRLDPEAWTKPQHMVTAEHPALVIPAATAYTPETYGALSRRLLYDEAFADDVAAEQTGVALRLVDREAFWRHVLDCYATWRAASAG